MYVTASQQVCALAAGFIEIFDVQSFFQAMTSSTVVERFGANDRSGKLRFGLQIQRVFDAELVGNDRATSRRSLLFDMTD